MFEVSIHALSYRHAEIFINMKIYRYFQLSYNGLMFELGRI